MEGDQQVSRAEAKIQGLFKCPTVKKLKSMETVEARTTHEVHRVGVFAQLNDSPAVTLGGDKMHL
jgi:hypothetical protein